MAALLLRPQVETVETPPQVFHGRAGLCGYIREHDPESRGPARKGLQQYFERECRNTGPEVAGSPAGIQGLRAQGTGEQTASRGNKHTFAVAISRMGKKAKCQPFSLGIRKRTEPHIPQQDKPTTSRAVLEAENYFLQREEEASGKEHLRPFTFKSIEEKTNLVVFYTGLPHRDFFISC
ncbi:uncharacterized protein ISCGN_001333 [Ixodes scapularis]